MTEQGLRDLVALWQNRLGLDHWTIVVKIAEPEVDGRACVMKVHRSVYYDQATITVHPAAIGKGELPDSIEKDILDQADDHTALYEGDIVHELLHCCLRDLMEAGDLVTDQLHRDARTVWDEAWRRAEEATVERLAKALVALAHTPSTLDVARAARIRDLMAAG